MDTNLFNLLLQSRSQGDNTPWPVIIAALAASIPAILAYFKGLKVEKDVAAVHLSVNSKLDQWLAVSKQQGKTEERQEANAAQAGPSQKLTEEQLRQLVTELTRK